MDLQEFRRSLLHSIPEEKADAGFCKMLREDIGQQIRALTDRVEPGKPELYRGFHYLTVIHIDNLQYGPILLNCLMDQLNRPLDPKMSVRAFDLVDFVRKDLISVVTFLPFEGPGIRKTLKYDCELERFKIISPRYPVSVTFRVAFDDEHGKRELDRVVVVHTADWYLPGLVSLVYSKNLVTVEASDKCIMFLSTVLYRYRRGLDDDIEEQLKREVYKIGFRSTIYAELPLPEQ